MCDVSTGIVGRGWEGLAEVVIPEPRPKEVGVEKRRQRGEAS